MIASWVRSSREGEGGGPIFVALVASPSLDVHRIVREAAARVGVGVVVARDLPTAVVVATEAHPRVAFVDITMAGGAGVALAHHLQLHHAPVSLFAMTPPGKLPFALDAMALGAAGILPFPPDGDAVGRALSEVIERMTLEARLVRAEEQVKTLEQELESYRKTDRAAAREVVLPKSESARIPLSFGASRDELQTALGSALDEAVARRGSVSILRFAPPSTAAAERVIARLSLGELGGAWDDEGGLAVLPKVDAYGALERRIAISSGGMAVGTASSPEDGGRPSRLLEIARRRLRAARRSAAFALDLATCDLAAGLEAIAACPRIDGGFASQESIELQTSSVQALAVFVAGEALRSGRAIVVASGSRSSGLARAIAERVPRWPSGRVSVRTSEFENLRRADVVAIASAAGAWTLVGSERNGVWRGQHSADSAVADWIFARAAGELSFGEVARRRSEVGEEDVETVPPSGSLPTVAVELARLQSAFVRGGRRGIEGGRLILAGSPPVLWRLSGASFAAPPLPRIVARVEATASGDPLPTRTCDVVAVPVIPSYAPVWPLVFAGAFGVVRLDDARGGGELEAAAAAAGIGVVDRAALSSEELVVSAPSFAAFVAFAIDASPF